MTIYKLLIANRGEIAGRIIRTAQAMGYETVAVFSDADADAPYVALADQAVRLGGAEVSDSYLNVERLLAAAKQAGADAVHPGYGFLSENADFAQRVQDAGLVWVGPPPAAMALMGNKATARQRVAAAGVPIVPGYDGAEQTDAAFLAAAETIGYPVMVKAAAGGGGRGMRLVGQPADLPTALAAARSEALKAFGSNELLLEKAIINPRHVEVQIFADQHGHIIHLGERDCSIQRRHQKVIEEAPSPAVSAELRQRMGETAVSAAKSVGYVGAGTVEFLLDEAGQFYFIEMNTRLQVEHPVTEMVTGLDLVAWQLKVAAGEPLPLTQEQVLLNGHAIEARLYAEDPDNQFLPSTGTLHLWQPPQEAGVRVDHGLATGLAVSPFYDPLLAKIIAWGATREEARRRLWRALGKTAVLGLTTNRRFLRQTAVHPTFVNGQATTRFIEENWPPAANAAPSPQLAALAGLLLYQRQPLANGLWNWQSRPFRCCLGERMVIITAVSANDYQIQTDNDTFHFRSLHHTANSLRFEQDGLRDALVYAFAPDGELWVQWGEETAVFRDNLQQPPASSESAGSGNILAPMPGSIRRLAVAVGDTVAVGQTLLILEAMKMEHAIPAPFAGTISQILVQEGEQMQARQLMVVLEEGNQ
ncbi:MAG: acetyl-CoA carboxylase biotin carboxylase subunit [Ardenticatenaceae bacterium]|nr:acetyl-CoA carboxylase biotin carboxylase subunit [Ardenticatenaceae bacterium]